MVRTAGGVSCREGRGSTSGTGRRTGLPLGEASSRKVKDNVTIIILKAVIR